MVNVSYQLTNKGMENHAKICEFAAEQIEKVMGVKVGLKLTSFTNDYPFWDGLDRSLCFRDRGTLNTQYGEFCKQPHMELGGINGRNAFSIRKITDWIVDDEKKEVWMTFEEKMEKFLTDNDYCRKETEKECYDSQESFQMSLFEMIDNAISRGATKITINGLTLGEVAEL